MIYTWHYKYNLYIYILVYKQFCIQILNIYKDNYLFENEDEDEDEKEDDEENLEDETRELEGLKPSQEIASLSRYNNNVYLSTTIDIQEGFVYYYKDIREMIEKGYLCDYTIHIPIFSEDPTNKNVCEYLIKNYRNIIIYCNSKKEGDTINKLMNSIQKGCSQYIDCDTGKLTRNKIINKYKSGDIPFLVNVRILVEGFDAPITKGVVFMHLPSNGKTIIQIIGRCLRLHNEKTIANVILPFSNKGDEDSINNFLKVMAKNDSRLRKSYERKSLGGYISINRVIDEQDNIKDEQDNIKDEQDEEQDEEDNEIELKFNMIFDSMGKMKNSVELWMIRIEEVKKYIDENGRRPSRGSKDKGIKSMAQWIRHCQQNYSKKTKNMKDETIYKLWTDFINDSRYKEYFLSQYDSFVFNLNKLKLYIDTNKKRPSNSNKDKIIKSMAQWISDCQKNYSKKTEKMKDETIYKLWTEFINDAKYKKYMQLPTMFEKFVFDLNKLKLYIDTNKQRPSNSSKDKGIKSMGSWIGNCQNNYSNKIHKMKDETIYNLWTDFINDAKYKTYFK